VVLRQDGKYIRHCCSSLAAYQNGVPLPAGAEINHAPGKRFGSRWLGSRPRPAARDQRRRTHGQSATERPQGRHPARPEGSEQVEFTEPRKAVLDAGAAVDVISAERGKARTCNHDLEPSETFTVDKTFDQVSADDYDALLIPGGTVGADKLRGDPDAVSFVRGFFQAGKPAGVICHGPWTLVEAGVVRDRT
jgi:DJ-1/PfpI family